METAPLQRVAVSVCNGHGVQRNRQGWVHAEDVVLLSPSDREDPPDATRQCPGWPIAGCFDFACALVWLHFSKSTGYSGWLEAVRPKTGLAGPAQRCPKPGPQDRDLHNDWAYADGNLSPTSGSSTSDKSALRASFMSTPGPLLPPARGLHLWSQASVSLHVFPSRFRTGQSAHLATALGCR
jgi:hypothetical protein